MTDFRWIPGCGFRIGPDGDLDDTSRLPSEGLLELIRTRLESSEEGWQLYPEIGAGLSSLVGSAASEETALLAERMTVRVLSGLAPSSAISARAYRIQEGIEVEVLVSGQLLGTVSISSDSVQFSPGGSR